MKIFGKKVGIANQPLWKRNKNASIAAAPVFHRMRDKLGRRSTVSATASLEGSETTSKSATSSEHSSSPPSSEHSSSPPSSEHLSPPSEQRLSPLSTLVSKFIAENARKTHDSIQDEKERRDFLFDLRESLTSLRSGKDRAPRRSISSSVSYVIDFFTETTQGTLTSIQDEEERIDFEEHLARELWQNFDDDGMTPISAPAMQ